MIRAVSRQILEVNHTENKYFEKAWLVVNPEYSCIGAGEIETEAGAYLGSVRPPYNLTNKKISVGTVINSVLSALGGGILAICCLYYGSL